MAITHLFTHSGNCGAPAGGTIGPFDCSGATFLAVHVAYYSALSGFPDLSDSHGNTYTPKTKRENVSASWWNYVFSPTVSGSMSFTATKHGLADVYPNIIIHGFTGVASFDQESGATAGSAVTSLQPGSLTPPASGALILAGLGVNVISGLSVDSGLTLTEVPDSPGVCVTGATGWKIQSPAAAINPTFSWTGANECGTSMLTFLAAVGANQIESYAGMDSWV